MEKGENYWESVAQRLNEELSELYAARDEHTTELETINERIFDRERVLTSLQPLATSALSPAKPTKIEGISALPLTEAIRTILQTIQTFQTARAIRDILEASGYDLTVHSNPLASVHGILKRFLESGEVVTLDAKGKAFYRIAKLKQSRRQRNISLESIIKASAQSSNAEKKTD